MSSVNESSGLSLEVIVSVCFPSPKTLIFSPLIETAVPFVSEYLNMSGDELALYGKISKDNKSYIEMLLY